MGRALAPTVGALLVISCGMPGKTQEWRVLSPPARVVLDEWSRKGFVPLYLPKLGESVVIIRKLDSQHRILPGVNFEPPRFPPNIRLGSDLNEDTFRRNNSFILDMTKASGVSVAKGIWIGTQLPSWIQLPGKSWDYKALATKGFWSLEWERLDQIGYYNNGFTGSVLYSREDLARGNGAFKDIQSRLGRTRYDLGGNLTFGNKPDGFIFLNMGIDYYESGQHIRDFLDKRFGSELDLLGRSAERDLRAALKRSAEEEFARRWALMREEAQVHDQKTYQAMMIFEAERRERVEREQEAKQRAEQQAKAEKEKEEEEKKRRARRNRQQQEEQAKEDEKKRQESAPTSSAPASPALPKSEPPKWTPWYQEKPYDGGQGYGRCYVNDCPDGSRPTIRRN